MSIFNRRYAEPANVRATALQATTLRELAALAYVNAELIEDDWQTRDAVKAKRDELLAAQKLPAA